MDDLSYGSYNMNINEKKTKVMVCSKDKLEETQHSNHETGKAF